MVDAPAIPRGFVAKIRWVIDHHPWIWLLVGVEQFATDHFGGSIIFLIMFVVNLFIYEMWERFSQLARRITGRRMAFAFIVIGAMFLAVGVTLLARFSGVAPVSNVTPSAEDVANATAPIRAELGNAKQQAASFQSQLTAAIKERDDARSERDVNNQKLAFLNPMAIGHDTSRQEPLNKLDDVIKLSIWEGVSTSNMNALTGTYNMIDYPLTQWLYWVKSADGRAKLIKELGNGAVAFMTAANDLEKLREEYQNYQDVVGVLAPQSNRADFAKALNDFSNAVSSISPDMPPNYDTKLRPLAGALRRELNTTLDWIQTLRRTADDKQKELSSMK